MNWEPEKGHISYRIDRSASRLFANEPEPTNKMALLSVSGHSLNYCPSHHEHNTHDREEGSRTLGPWAWAQWAHVGIRSWLCFFQVYINQDSKLYAERLASDGTNWTDSIYYWNFLGRLWAHDYSGVNWQHCLHTVLLSLCRYKSCRDDPRLSQSLYM